MKRVILIFIISVFLLCPYLKAEEVSLTLDEAIAIGLRDNRDILLKAEEVKKAKAKIQESHSELFPSLNFTSTYSLTRGYYSKDVSQTTTQTTLKQYVYKGGEIINTIQYNGYKFEVAQALLDKAKLEAVLNVKKAFYTLLLANEFVGVNSIILSNTKEHLNFFRARYNNGQASESDIISIESSLSNVKKAYEESLNQVEAARILLNNILYLDRDTKIRAEAQFDYEATEVAYDTAFLKAMQRRPEIKQLEAQTKADKKSIEIAKSDGRPSIYASWDYYSRSHSAVPTGIGKNWNDYNIIGATISWPIFDGWKTKAKVEQAIVDLRETQLLKEKTINDIALELKNSYLDLKNAIAKIEAVESEVKVYSDSLFTAKEKHKEGIASGLDLDDAKLKLKVSLFNRQEAIYDYIIAKARFEKASGGAQ
jgi:outer membrane protein TolC